ncbi:MAG: hypothetical protein M3083_09800 [Actinomycetota bacterium]|nr:hypothetical protein [Actinomycetota bacterium]
MTDRFDLLARVELLDGWPELNLDRSRVYGEIAPSKEFPDAAGPQMTDAYIRRVFEIASEEAKGVAASVADQRLAHFEILDHSELYAALGGMSVAQIRDEQEWWAPNWSWFLTLRQMQEAKQLDDPVNEGFAYIAPILLTAAADRLASFYGLIVRSGLEALNRRWRLHSGDKAAVTIIVETLCQRKWLFLKGPDERGRYLAPRRVNDEEVVQALAELRDKWDVTRSFPRPGKIRGGAAKPV